MTSIRFAPWKGENYQRAPFGRRVLVLGESHYQWRADQSLNERPSLTTDCIEEQIGGCYKKAFWTHIAVTFLNRRPTLEEKSEFWHAVSFYNYVQESAGMGPRVRPTEHMFEASAPAFFEVMEFLKPEVIVVLGYALWARLPRGSAPDEALKTADGVIVTRDYVYPGGRCRACSIKHPSSGFNGRKWHPRVMNVIRSVSLPLVP